MNLNEINGIKLMNGAELAAKVSKLTDNEMELEDAVFWDLVQLQDNKYDVQFFPLTNGAAFRANSTHFGMNVTIQRSAILFNYPLRPELEAKYKQLVSPIVLAR